MKIRYWRSKRSSVLVGLAGLIIGVSVGAGVAVYASGSSSLVSGGELTVNAWYTNNYSTGAGPKGVLFDGTNVWVANSTGSSVTKIKAATGKTVGTYALPANSGPVALAFDGTNIWTANSTGNSVSKLLASSGALIGTYALQPYGNSPAGIVYDGTSIWVVPGFSNNLFKIRPSTGAIDASYEGILYPSCSPDGLAFDGADVLVSCSIQSFIEKIPVADPFGQFSLIAVSGFPRTVSFDGTYAWTVNYEGYVQKIDVRTRTVVESYALPAGTSAVAFAFDQPGSSASSSRPIDPHTYMWTANSGSGSVSKIDATTGGVVGTYTVGGQPSGITFDGTNIWVTNYASNSVTVLQAR